MDGKDPERCGEWKLSREIGHGAYGVVYLAFREDGACAAVKVCRRDAVGDDRYERELRGAKLYRSIPPQEGLVRMRELVEADWGFYTVMDLADDEFGVKVAPGSGYRPKTLASVIDGEKALSLKECVKLAVSLTKGLSALQRHHLLHRDIKPANVLYIGGAPVLSDPGLLVEESEAVSTVGTPGYLPPERKFTDAAGDIYSLGLTLKAASFGRRLEDIDKGPAMEADTGAALFPAWWRILNKATDPTPSRRYQSAKALARDLRLLQYRSAFAPLGKWWLLNAVLVLSLICVTAYAMVLLKRSRTAGLSKEELDAQIKSVSQDVGKETAQEVLDSHIDKVTRETFWPHYLASKDGMLDFELHCLSNAVEWASKGDSVKEAKLYAEMEERLRGPLENSAAVLSQIKALYDRGQDKIKNGGNDIEEYRQAEELDKNRADLSNEVRSIMKEFRAAHSL